MPRDIEEKIKGGNAKNIIVLVVIWLSFFLAILSNEKARNFIYSIFGYSKPNYFEDVLLISKSGQEFSKAKIYFDAKPDVYDVIASPFSSGMFFASTNYGIFVSSDNGQGWYHLDLPKDIGVRTPVYRVFFNLKDPTEISILVLTKDSGLIYKTNDNFYSLKKSFEISADVAKKIIDDRSITTILPTGNNQYLIGTSN